MALLANSLAGVVRGATGSDVLASAARYAMIVYAAFAALTKLGITLWSTVPTVNIVPGGVVLALTTPSAPAVARCPRTSGAGSTTATAGRRRF